jgi:restriction system protein
MPVPDFQSLMLPLLEFAGDGKEHTSDEANEYLAKKFNLTEDDIKELIPSGYQTKFSNYVSWARSYFKMAGLFESPKRGILKITNEGLKVLSTKPEKINIKFLKTMPGFIERNKGIIKEEGKDSENEVDKKTPQELIDSGYKQIRTSLVQDILSQIKTCSPTFFERLVVELLVKMGYGGTNEEAGKRIGKSGDEGIDGIIKEDKLGLDTIYIQAKRWDGIVGRPEIQKFAGALMGQKAKKGVFITTSKFTNDALDYVTKIDNKIVLIDGDQLAQYMIDYDLGVSTVFSYDIKKIDSDYFSEE